MKRFITTLIFLTIVTLVYAQTAYELKTKVGNFVPNENLSDVLSAGLGNPNTAFSGNFYKIIQFKEIPSAAIQSNLNASGIKLLKYLPDYAYIASIPTNITLNAFDRKEIRSIISIPAQYKMSPKLQGTLPAHAVEGDHVNIVLSYYSDITHAKVTTALSAINVNIVESIEEGDLVIVKVPIASLDNFSSLPFVEWVEPISEPGEPEDRGGRTIHRSNVINSQAASGYSFDGSDVNVLVRDDGLVGPHIDYTGRLTNLTTDATGTHGDGVGGVMAGGGNLDPTITGMAPGAGVYVINYISNFLADNTLSLHQNDDVMVTNSSYSDGCNGGYTTITEGVDDQTFQNPNLLHVFSAGNSNNNDCGYGADDQWGNITGGHKIAKNVIATANLFANGTLVSSSSRGPAADGRLKPDISAHGQGQLATDPNNTYQVFGGTSAAAPGIAGVSAQLYEAYKSMNSGTNPEAALIKATLLNTADEKGNLGPDFKFGYGRVNAYKALKLLEDNRYLSSTVTQNVTKNHVISVPANVKQVKVMVYWAEEAPAIIAGPALINNLDLTLTTPTNSTFQPWVLNHAPNPITLDDPAVRGIDNLNNVEQVTLDDPSAGSYTIKVKGTTVPFGAHKYYVVYDFIYDEIMVTYPLGGEGFIPETVERIHWDAFGTTGNFLIEYTTNDGGSWTTIATVSGADRLYEWSVPSIITGEAKIRVSRSGNSDESDETFTIITRPVDVSYTAVCSNTWAIFWDPVPGATGYDVFLLGSETMEVVGSTTEHFYQFTGAEGMTTNWFSVRATGPNGIRSRRINAIFPEPSGVTCYVMDDLVARSMISPGPNVSNCYGPKIDVKLAIRNQGQNDVNSYIAAYQLDGGAIVTENMGFLGAGNSLDYTFDTQLMNVGAGSHNLKTWVFLADDEERSNDTLSRNIDVISTVIAAPYTENFNGESNCGTDSDCGATLCPLGIDWVNLPNGSEDDIDWRVNSGGTPSVGTGPTNDHDIGNGTGKYLYLEASSGCYGQTAILLSPCFDLSGMSMPEFSFYYHMLGISMGTLHVDLFDGDEWIIDYGNSIAGNQGNSWFQYVLDLSPYVGNVIQLRIRGVTGVNWESDLAIDLLTFTENDPGGDCVGAGDCPCEPGNTNHEYLDISGGNMANPSIDAGTYHASIEVSSEGCVETSTAVHFRAGTDIKLNPGFHAKPGSDFTAILEACTASLTEQEVPAESRQFIVPDIAINTDIALKVFPNPFLYQTKIELALEKTTKLDLVIFDQLGRQVHQVAPLQVLQEGIHHFILDGKLLRNGIYFLELKTDTERVVKKIVKTE